LGVLYWKLPYTTLPEDLMMNPLHPLAAGLDKMGLNFLVDESLPYFTEAQDLEKAGKWAEAQKAYGEALKFNSQNPQIYVSLGKIALALDQPKTAVDWFNKALLLAPTDDVTYALLAQAYEATNQTS